jgi:F0F1-type ATP synthase membrane subunit b/b'
MGYNQRNDEIRDNVERIRRDREAYADALANVEQSVAVPSLTLTSL